MLRWIYQNIPNRLLAHAFVKIYHFAPYLCSILPQRSAILSQHIMFHLAPGVTYGWNAPCHTHKHTHTHTYIYIYILSMYQSKLCENVKKKWIIIFNHIHRFCDMIYHSSQGPEFHCSIFLPTCHFTPAYHAPFYPRYNVSISRAMSTTLSPFARSKGRENM